MPTRKPSSFDASGHAAEVPCNYCRVFKSRNLELCKHCGIYERRLADITGWMNGVKESGVGNTLPILNLAVQQLVNLLRRQGGKNDQIDQLITRLMQDALADASKDR